MGVDVVKFRRQTPYQPWDGNGPCRIVSCGRLNACKGHDDLIHAVALLRGRGIQATLHIAGQDDSGSGAYRAYLTGLAQELGVAEQVQLLGAVSESVVRSELESAHVFALASLHEPLGVAIMEAMALELPVVVTGAGGVAELVDDGDDGVLVRPRDPADLADKLLRVLREPELARRLGKAARSKVKQSFHNYVSAEVLADCLGCRKSTAAETSATAPRPVATVA